MCVRVCVLSLSLSLYIYTYMCVYIYNVLQNYCLTSITVLFVSQLRNGFLGKNFKYRSTLRKRTHRLHFLCFPPRGSNHKQLTANLALHFYTDFLPNKQDYINCCTEAN